MKRTTWMAGLVLVAGAGVAAWAGTPGDRPGPKERTSLKERLDLTDEQAEQMRQLHSDQRKTGIQRRADLQVVRLELHELIASPSLDEKAVRAKAKQLADLQASGLMAHVDERLAMRKLLTPEQVERLRTLGPRHERRGRFGRGRGGPRHAGPGWGGPEAGAEGEGPSGPSDEEGGEF